MGCPAWGALRSSTGRPQPPQNPERQCRALPAGTLLRAPGALSARPCGSSRGGSLRYHHWISSEYEAAPLARNAQGISMSSPSRTVTSLGTSVNVAGGGRRERRDKPWGGGLGQPQARRWLGSRASCSPPCSSTRGPGAGEVRSGRCWAAAETGDRGRTLRFAPRGAAGAAGLLSRARRTAGAGLGRASSRAPHAASPQPEPRPASERAGRGRRRCADPARLSSLCGSETRPRAGMWRPRSRPRLLLSRRPRPAGCGGPGKDPRAPAAAKFPRSPSATHSSRAGSSSGGGRHPRAPGRFRCSISRGARGGGRPGADRRRWRQRGLGSRSRSG